MNLTDRVHNNLEKIEKFLKERNELMIIDQRSTIREIKAETLHIYTTAYIQTKGDVEKAFGDNFSPMIELQHKTIQFLTV